MLEDKRIHQVYKDFWNQDKDHIVKKHPLLQKKGAEIAKDAHQYVRNVVDTMFPRGDASSQVYNALQQCRMLERGHEAELEDLARRIVIDMFNIDIQQFGLPPEELLQFKIGIVPQNLYPMESKIRKTINESEQQGDNLNRRILRLMITQGGAMHNFFSAFHLPYVVEEINKIDPRLLNYYKIFAYGSSLAYWDNDLKRVMQSIGRAGLQGAANYTKYKAPEKPIDKVWDETDWDNFTLENYYSDSALITEEADDSDKGFGGYVIRAVGSIFPVLVQEAIKGVLSFLTAETDIDENENERLKEQTGTNPWDEIPYIQAGHEIWRKLLKVKPKELGLAHFVKLFGMLNAKDANAIVSASVYMPDEATNLITQKAQEFGFIDKPEEPEEYQFEEPQDPDLDDNEDPDWWRNT